MCTVVLERNRTNDRFLVMNTILARTKDFSVEDIVNEFKIKDVDIGNMLVEDCLEDLIDNGLIYEIGSRYMVRNRQKRWNMM